MKKTLFVNLNGRMFTIDEDAYRLLEIYLSNLRIHFRKEEGAAEIIADFEARIAELFIEKTRLGYQVITFEHVEEVIARVGKPADFETNDENGPMGESHFTEPGKTKKKFFRNVDNKALGGVCSGIATYFDWNVALVRVVFILLILVLASFRAFDFYTPFRHILFWPFTMSLPWLIILAYIIAWIVVPTARTAEQKLKMKGQPVTVENIGKTIAAQSEPVAHKEPNGCLDFFVTFLKVCLAGCGCIIGLPILIILFIVLFALLIGVGGRLMDIANSLFGEIPSFAMVNHPVLATITLILVIGIPVVAIIYGIIAYFAKLKPINQIVKWLFLSIWIVALIFLSITGIRFTGPEIKWKWRISSKESNNVMSHNTVVFSETITAVEKTSNYLCVDLYIEQTDDKYPSLEISGDEKLIDELKFDIKDGKLLLSANSGFSSDNSMKIILRTNELKTVLMGSKGNVYINGAFSGDRLVVRLKGVGNFYADSLYVQSLTIRTEGVGSANISGKAQNTELKTSGVGKINARELLSDTIYAVVDGVGAISCNPVDYFDASTHGVGTITYKNEPKNFKKVSLGVGSIRKR